jgi:hypothetical protein
MGGEIQQCAHDDDDSKRGEQREAFQHTDEPTTWIWDASSEWTFGVKPLAVAFCQIGRLHIEPFYYGVRDAVR